MKQDNLVDDIKSRIDIVDLVSEFLSLKKSGQNYKGLCPFHAEKTPSFMVHPARQIFHCFGCGKGGDAITFIMEHEQMTFNEAIELLARRTGISLASYARGDSRQKSVRESLYKINEAALHFFRASLRTSARAASYIRDRGLADETVEQFHIGYSRPERDSLLRHLKSQGFGEDVIKLSGLVYFGERGIYDFFRDRVMFPLFDLQGRVIAFGGRILSADIQAPKYLNSSESPVFRKSDALFGLNLSRQAISQKGYGVLVEGYLDVVTCHQEGLTNVVAPLGTALTAEHLRRLKRFSEKVVILFDGDNAGVAAAQRALDLVFDESMTAKILLLPEGDDPDSYVRKHGVERLRRLLGSALSPVQFIVKLFGKNRLDAVRVCLSLIARCPDGLLREQTLGETSEQSGIAEAVLRDELKTLLQKHGKPIRYDRSRPVTSQTSKSQSIIDAPREEIILLSIALSTPEKTHAIAQHLDLASITCGKIRGLFEMILKVSGRDDDEKLMVPRILDLCSEEEKSLVTHLLVEPQIDSDRVDKSVSDCFKMMAVHRIEQEIRTAEAQGDAETLRNLISRKNILLGRRDSFGPPSGEATQGEE